LASITYGSRLHISPPGTGLSALADDGNWWWAPAPIRFEDTSGIEVLPTGDQKIGDPVMSGDAVRLRHNGEIVGVSRSTRDLVSVLRPDPSVETMFTIHSRMVGYECEKGVCTRVNIGFTKPGATVYRSPGCYNQCRTADLLSADDKRHRTSWIMMVVVLTVTLVVACVAVILVVRR
jgi:hypothetical protein